jgi:uncharacterized membrane protein (UPF0127 family)
MTSSSLAPRLRRLPVATVLGREVRVATTFSARLLGLAHLDREETGPGLLILRCSSVHTFGMRFPLDLYFLDQDGVAIEVRQGVWGRRLASCRRSVAVVELPSPADIGT